MSLYSLLKSAHSGWRWVVLALLVAAIVKLVEKSRKHLPLTPAERKWGLFAMIAFHIQFLVGWLLYFLSPKVAFVQGFMSNKLLRFYTIEHLVLMLVAFVCITVGYKRIKKAVQHSEYAKRGLLFYALALLVILLAIPWPFRTALGAAWY